MYFCGRYNLSLKLSHIIVFSWLLSRSLSRYKFPKLIVTQLWVTQLWNADSCSCKSKSFSYWKVTHFDSLWRRGTRELGNGLLHAKQKDRNCLVVYLCYSRCRDRHFDLQCHQLLYQIIFSTLPRRTGTLSCSAAKKKEKQKKKEIKKKQKLSWLCLSLICSLSKHWHQMTC